MPSTWLESNCILLPQRFSRVTKGRVASSRTCLLRPPKDCANNWLSMIRACGLTVPSPSVWHLIYFHTYTHTETQVCYWLWWWFIGEHAFKFKKGNINFLFAHITQAYVCKGSKLRVYSCNDHKFQIYIQYCCNDLKFQVYCSSTLTPNSKSASKLTKNSKSTPTLTINSKSTPALTPNSKPTAALTQNLLLLRLQNFKIREASTVYENLKKCVIILCIDHRGTMFFNSINLRSAALLTTPPGPSDRRAELRTLVAVLWQGLRPLDNHTSIRIYGHEA